ncbi:SGNH/GDSL hydrolase family protein [Tunturiibacter empetritectus]
MVATVFAGTNDLNSYPTPLQTMSFMSSEIATLKAAGCRVFVGTMLSRAGNAGAGGTMDAAKDSYDALILSGAKIAGAEGVIDFAAEPLIGADGASANGSNFPDGIHPSQTLQNRMGVIASNTLNYSFGFSQLNPHVVTAATYTMLSGDGYVTASPVANQTLTLPDCTGPSGATYTVSNIQSAFTVGVVTGSSSQLINGLAAGTVVPVPPNKSLTLRDVPNPKTVSGCHWEM